MQRKKTFPISNAAASHSISSYSVFKKQNQIENTNISLVKERKKKENNKREQTAVMGFLMSYKLLSSRPHRVKHIHLSPHHIKPNQKRCKKVDGMFLPFCGLNEQADPTLTVRD